jgi:hypothetical protein
LLSEVGWSEVGVPPACGGESGMESQMRSMMVPVDSAPPAHMVISAVL